MVGDTIEVYTGWNIVGSLASGAVLDILISEPPDIIISAFFAYNPGGGYDARDTLKKGSGYWVKVNADGFIVFNLRYENACPGLPSVYYEGKNYNTVQIGDQCWLRDNLDIGTMIPVTDTAKNNGIIEKFCYSNNQTNCDTYGGLYQWSEAMQYTTTPGARGICPAGWHIPTYSELQTLSSTVSGDGNALKAVGQGGGSYGAGTNTSGFSALLAGYSDGYGHFTFLGLQGYFWSSTQASDQLAGCMYLWADSDDISFYTGRSKLSGYSIRCLKN
jgi:uncharacterized protein (TIGR02145 family)